MSNNDKKAQLERELLDLKKVIREYRKTPSAFRNVTESEYKNAIRRFYEVSTELAELDKPADPLDELTIDDLKDLYEQEKAKYRWGAGYGRQGGKLLRIQTKINQLETERADQ